jgi:hypothetical protein
VTRLQDRAGKSGIGCLGTIVLLVLVAYFGGRFFPPWLANQQFRDEMKTDARFGATLPDSMIRMRLVALADTLGIPPEGKKISIRRRPGRPPTITISTAYTVRVTLPIFGVKLLHFKPSAEEPL